eukprot:3120140-Alexandrium_andersonii.AAC.1
MAMVDLLRPRSPVKPILGVFRKNHLTAFLQLLKSGTATWPDATERLQVPSGNRLGQLHDVLEHGIEMEVWPCSAVRQREEAFLVLMARGKFDA